MWKVKISISVLLIGVSLFFLLVGLSSCKSIRRNEFSSTTLSIKDPQNISSYIVGRKIIAQSSVSGCPTVKFPQLSEDIEDLDTYGEISTGTVNLSLRKDCLPYEVTLSYKCLEYEDGLYPYGRCFTGRASTFMGELLEDTLKLQIPLEGIGQWANIKVNSAIGSSSYVKVEDFFSSEFLKKAESVSVYGTDSVYAISGVSDIDVKSSDVGHIKFSGANTVNASSKPCGFSWDKSKTDVVIISKINIDGIDLTISKKSFKDFLQSEVSSSIYFYGYSGSIENEEGTLKYTCESRIFVAEFGD